MSGIERPVLDNNIIVKRKRIDSNLPDYYEHEDDNMSSYDENSNLNDNITVSGNDANLCIPGSFNDVDNPLVSVIMPIFNAEIYLEEAFQSICAQTYRPLEVVCFNDCSTDSSWEIMQKFKDAFSNANVTPVMLTSNRDRPSGPGFGRNTAVQNSHGLFICHLDADDYMHPKRVEMQYELYQELHARSKDKHSRGENNDERTCANSSDSDDERLTLIGANFERCPHDSTPFYTNWLNSLSHQEMLLQQYRECTIICPSWFYAKDVYDKVFQHNQVGFVEKDPKLGRVPEDLLFFLDHLILGGRLAKVERPLVTYRYVHTSWSIGTKAVDLQRVRIKYLQEAVISKWNTFSIYGSGYDAKKFINLLDSENAKKIQMLGDISEKRIGTKYFHQGIRKHIPIVHISQLEKPLIICVASKRAGMELETNIQSLALIEGTDFFRFN